MLGICGKQLAQLCQRTPFPLFASDLCVQTQPLALPSLSTASTPSTQMRDDRDAPMRVVLAKACGPLAPLEPRQNRAYAVPESPWTASQAMVQAGYLANRPWGAWADAAHCRKPAIIRG